MFSDSIKMGSYLWTDALSFVIVKKDDFYDQNCIKDFYQSFVSYFFPKIWKLLFEVSNLSQIEKSYTNLKPWN